AVRPRGAGGRCAGTERPASAAASAAANSDFRKASGASSMRRDGVTHRGGALWPPMTGFGSRKPVCYNRPVVTGPGTIAAAGLLAAAEPPPFELVNGEGAAPLLFVCDHAGRAIPRALGRLGLDEATLARHIAWDIGIADLTRALAFRFGAPAVLATYSRL